MMRLVKVELRRLLSRRAVVLLLGLGLVVSILITAGTAWSSKPLDDGDLATAERERADQVSMCEEHPRQWGARSAEKCEQMVGPVDDYVWRDQLTAGTVRDVAPALGGALMLLGLLAGTSFLGAEFTSGSISNLLLFEPRRFRVWAAKLLALGATIAVWAAVCWALLLIPLVAFGRSWDPDKWGDQWLSNFTNLGLRGVLLVGAAAIVGAALTAALRSTIATVGVVVGYLVIVEAVLAAVIYEQSVDWVMSSRVLGFLLAPHIVEIWSNGNEPSVHVFGLQTSATFLGIGVALVLALSYAVFRRRDIA